MSTTKGYAVAIRRTNGTIFFAAPKEGFATTVWPNHADAVAHAKECRKHKLDAIAVVVEYTEPVIIGPARVLKGIQP
jgi:hypothetical protein